MRDPHIFEVMQVYSKAQVALDTLADIVRDRYGCNITASQVLDVKLRNQRIMLDFEREVNAIACERTGDSMFPVLADGRPDGCPHEIEIKHLNNEHALLTHKQSLSHLKRRGGMCPMEIVMNVERRPMDDLLNGRISEEYALEFVKKLEVDRISDT